MNEQLQQALASILNVATDGIKAGTTFLEAQLPDVIQQLLMWKAVESLVYVGIGLCMVVSGCILLKYCIKKINGVATATCDSFWCDYYSTSGNGVGFGGVLLTLSTAPITISGLCAFFGNLMTPLQIWIAPKIYLLEYATHLAK